LAGGGRDRDPAPIFAKRVTRYRNISLKSTQKLRVAIIFGVV